MVQRRVRPAFPVSASASHSTCAVLLAVADVPGFVPGKIIAADMPALGSLEVPQDTYLIACALYGAWDRNNLPAPLAQVSGGDGFARPLLALSQEVSQRIPASTGRDAAFARAADDVAALRVSMEELQRQMASLAATMRSQAPSLSAQASSR
jgi:hypothetical protein